MTERDLLREDLPRSYSSVKRDLVHFSSRSASLQQAQYHDTPGFEMAS